ncbi:dimethylaniline monooxygenase [Dulcicalothrix desertica PCC 7102]|uniref:Dimethylaniline monooxygenase n=1 Tax=Dulcicalothrix desertica PCC 7102 TaxID=232991 RepID=A0A433VMA8_9CYAN|nr:NAD(P)-binding domain-containing protein [Dulcicalothrix desertica]RUT07244.1 dimethylaniline monooxygenase [Dulcicalothrix desertica PCC 7102]TWH61762.1 dimethylaniline monooxygenase (N-oxide forming) [Dulcicalothrix desertica PCC 7102]
MTTTQSKTCIVIGAGISGLVTAKELIEVGIDNLIILEKSQVIGGVWQKYCWDSATLTSSKWVTEFGSCPMPDEYPDFLKPEQMIEYLHSFAKLFHLKDRIHCGVIVQSIQKNHNKQYNIITNKGTYNCDFVIICSGVHGKPDIPDIPGLKDFSGTVIHGSNYKKPQLFQDKRVLCMGLGESGIGISSEISTVAARTIISASSFPIAPRVFPHTDIPFDQLQFWPIGQYIKDYQEILNLGISWYYKIPKFIQPAYAKFHLYLRLFPQEWLPKAVIPYHWHAKFWPKAYQDTSGNLTRPENSTDDILYLVHSNKIIPKGKVVKFEQNRAYFKDSSFEEIDAVVINTGYKPGLLSIELPNNWQYRHQELYKGCFHPEMPNLAFVGLVRPTVGSIPAMAEMQARFIAQVLSDKIQLPQPQKLKKIIEKEANKHARNCPAMQNRFPNVYFFDHWMEEMAELIGCRPKIWCHLSSWNQLQAYLFGAPEPLRFRLRGPGNVKDGYERYAARVTKTYNTNYSSQVRSVVLFFFFYPHVLTLLLAAILLWGVKLSLSFSLTIAALFWLLYMNVDLFRLIFWIPNLLRVNLMLAKVLVQYNHRPTHDEN